MSETPTTDHKKEVVDCLDRIKALVLEIDTLMPKILEGTKSSARTARNNLNSIKKIITPMRQNIQEIVKPSKPKA